MGAQVSRITPRSSRSSKQILPEGTIIEESEIADPPPAMTSPTCEQPTFKELLTAEKCPAPEKCAVASDKPRSPSKESEKKGTDMVYSKLPGSVEGTQTHPTLLRLVNPPAITEKKPSAQAAATPQHEAIIIEKAKTTRRRLSIVTSGGEKTSDIGAVPGLAPESGKAGVKSRRRLSLSGGNASTNLHNTAGILPEPVLTTHVASMSRRRLTIMSMNGTEGGPTPVIDALLEVPGDARMCRRRSSMLSGGSSMAGPAARRRSSMLSGGSSMAGPAARRRRSSLGSTHSHDGLVKQINSRISEDSDSLSDFGIESDPGAGFGSSESESEQEEQEPADGKQEMKAELKAELKAGARRNSGAFCTGFKPMMKSASSSNAKHAVPLATFLGMKELKSFEELQEESALSEFKPGMVTIFVAMQWCGKDHPDRKGDQLRILQAAIRNLAEGKATVSGDLRRPEDAYSEGELAELASTGALHIWLDYCCMPTKPRKAEAVASIPLIVERCQLFAMLMPPKQPEDAEADHGYKAWRGRGWCRLACTTRALSTDDTRMLLVQDEKHMLTLSSEDFMFDPPCTGQFDSQEERTHAAQALKGLVEEKRDSFIDCGFLQDYRLLRATQHLLLQGADIPKDDDSSSESGLSDGSGDESEDEAFQPSRSRSQDPKTKKTDGEEGSKNKQPMSSRNNARDPTLPGGLVSRRVSVTGMVNRTDKERAWDFLRTYGLISAQRADESGHTAQHYAAASGKPVVAKSLAALGSTVEVQAGLLGERQKCCWPLLKGMTPLHFAALLGPNRPCTVQGLISLSAAKDARDWAARTPLMLCCRSGNTEAARVLVKAGADVKLADELGNTALHQAAAFGHAELVSMLTKAGAKSSQTKIASAPLFDMALCCDTSELVEPLVAAGCAIDAALPAKVEEAVLKSFLASKPSTVHQHLRVLLEHHKGMTPLMAAAVGGNRNVATALIRAGSDPERRNEVGCTAADLAHLSGFGLDFLKAGQTNAEN